MTDKVELIKAKVEEKINLYERLLNAGKGGGAGLMSKIVALQGVLIDINFIQIDSLSEEPVSEDLEEAAKENAKIERSDDTEVGYDINRFDGFVDGAKWDRQRTINKACEWLDKYASDFVALADDSHPAIGDTQAFYSTKSLLHYFRQEMED